MFIIYKIFKVYMVIKPNHFMNIYNKKKKQVSDSEFEFEEMGYVAM